MNDVVDVGKLTINTGGGILNNAAEGAGDVLHTAGEQAGNVLKPLQTAVDQFGTALDQAGAILDQARYAIADPYGTIRREVLNKVQDVITDALASVSTGGHSSQARVSTVAALPRLKLSMLWALTCRC